MSTITLFATFIGLLHRQAHALPATPDPPPQFEPSFKENPDGRGTLGIILPCVLTLLLCGWTAMHMPVPSNPSPFGVFLQRAKWTAISILVPETVLFMAIKEWIEAKEIRKVLLRKQWLRKIEEGVGEEGGEEGEEGEDEDGPPDGEWPDTKELIGSWSGWLKRDLCFWRDKEDRPPGLDAAFLATMGGVVVRPRGRPETPHRILTPVGFCVLYIHGLINDSQIVTSVIEDKSKTDAVGKLITCLQGAWMVVQVVARVEQRLPVTLLELHTVAHVVCAVAMYFFWWSKPAGIQYPVVLELDDDVWKGMKWSEAESEDMAAQGDLVGNSDDPDTGCRNHIADTVDHVRDTWLRKLKIYYPFSVGPYNAVRVLRPVDMPVAAGEYVIFDSEDFNKCFEYTLNSLTPQTSNSDGSETSIFRELVDEKVHFLFFIALFYCGVHATAWEYLFPTRFEKTLWRVSTIASLALIPAESIVLMTITQDLARSGPWLLLKDIFATFAVERKEEELVVTVALGLLYSVLVTAFPALGLVRFFFLIESFIGLRALPKGAFETVEWGAYFPHFGGG